MTVVDCPVCGESGLIGLPRDATVEAVEAEPLAERGREAEIKTRRVRCRSDHDVYVTFQASATKRSRQ